MQQSYIGTKTEKILAGKNWVILFFVRRSLYQETSNKEGATVITLFLPPGFSRVMTHKTRQLGLSQLGLGGINHTKKPSRHGRKHISWESGRFDKVWPKLTKVDRGLTKALTEPKARSSRPPPNHWVEHIESFDSVLYGSKTNKKRGSYRQNRENRSNT